MSGRLIPALLLVGLGAVVGGVVGALVAGGPRGAGEIPGASDVAATTQSRVDEVEHRLVTLEKRASGRVRAGVERANAPEPGVEQRGAVNVWAEGAESAGGDGAASDVGVTTEFVKAVREAINTIRSEDAVAATERKRAQDFKRRMGEVDRRLRDYAAKLELTEEEATAFRAAAKSGLERHLTAQAEGASRDELAAIDREKERAYRDILGSAKHRDFRKLEIDQAARPVIVDAANRAGVDSHQRDQIERLLSDHIERYVDPEIRIRTEELDAETRASIMQDMNAANRAAWDRLRNQILTPEQRERVPIRLR